ncbi:MAG: hypothetical protein ACKOHG_01415, partial [Planctomycetia bacterium]
MGRGGRPSRSPASLPPRRPCGDLTQSLGCGRYTRRLSRLETEDRMPLADPNHPLAQLLDRDSRYKLDAYLFV